MGAWIEILPKHHQNKGRQMVAPHMGAWIEMIDFRITLSLFLSHPTWVRGLKFLVYVVKISVDKVAPHMGAWIEILKL